MIGRRAILGMLAGAPVAAPRLAKAHVEKYAAEIAGSGLMSGVSQGPVTNLDSSEGDGLDPVSSFRCDLWRERERLHYESAYNAAQTTLPVDIATKKSWSPAFKVGEATKRKAQIDALINALERDRSFAERILRGL